MRGLMKKRKLLALLVGLALWQASPWVGAVPQQLRYQGVLTDRTGKALNGRFNLTFRIYTVATGGTPLWTETQPNMPIERGLFGVTLGSVIPLNLPFDVPYWLSIEVGTDGEMLPRQPVTAAPTAIRTTTAEAIVPGALAPLYIVGNNVGIGTQTPTSTLDVVGTVQMTGFKLPTGAATGHVLTSDAAGIGTWQPGGGGGNSGWIREGTVVRLTTPTDNVGIGTTTPASPLTIKPSDNFAQLRLEQNNATDGWTFFADSGGGPLRISRVGAGQPVEKLTLTAGGNVGIGTTSPNAPLHVVDTVSADGESATFVGRAIHGADARAYFTFRHAEGPPEWWGIAIDLGGNFALHRTAGFDAISANHTTGNVGIGTAGSPDYRLDIAGAAHASSFPTSSDLRLKTNVTPLANVLDKVNRIRGVAFDWNEVYEQMGRATGHREIGLIAQEIEAVFPELVTRWGLEGFRAVDYGRLTAILLEAIKELKQRVEALEAALQSGQTH